MDDVDRMIVDHLVNDLHCSFADKVLKLADFDSAHIVEGIIRCIWRCRPESVATFPSFQLPNNPIERFRLASKISREVQTIGVRDHQIGYQALLYPNVFDSRHIFLALFEHFPKETVKSTDEKPLSPIEKLRAEVGAVIADQLKGEWTPEFCRFYDLQRIGRLWFPSDRKAEEEKQQSSDVWTTVNCTGQQPKDGQTFLKIEPPKIAPKPKLVPKSPPPPHQPLPIASASADEEIATAKNASNAPTDETIATQNQLEDEAKRQNAREKMAKKRSEMVEKRRMLAKLRHANVLLADQIAARQQRIGATDERLAQLLAEPTENLQKLEHFIASADARRSALEQKFVEAERQRLCQLDALIESANDGQMGEAAAITVAGGKGAAEGANKLAELNGTICALEQLLEQRQRIRQKLFRECQRMDETSDGNAVDVGEGRSKYVQRILEMSAMVGKQNEEIRRTAKSVQNLRREIGQLLGTLERTFIAVDRWLSKSAEDNARMQRAYKLMVRTHEQCSLVMTCIEDQGQLSRHTDELIDKISVEQQKSVDEQLEKLLDDLMIISHENIELEKRIANFSLKAAE
ncbi:hypothetical protein niasHS_007835 [Heterodera schachtii]|uniref:Coiled-coil domain-containing protein 22 homolog n=2 Tax=Heterodera TaxID=34509 RepID=A0ABD2JPS6_HETSC